MWDLMNMVAENAAKGNTRSSSGESDKTKSTKKATTSKTKSKTPKLNFGAAKDTVDIRFGSFYHAPHIWPIGGGTPNNSTPIKTAEATEDDTDDDASKGFLAGFRRALEIEKNPDEVSLFERG